MYTSDFVTKLSGQQSFELHLGIASTPIFGPPIDNHFLTVPLTGQDSIIYLASNAPWESPTTLKSAYKSGCAYTDSHAFSAYDLNEVRIESDPPFPTSIHTEVVLAYYPNSLVNYFIPGLAQASPIPWKTAIGVENASVMIKARSIDFISFLNEIIIFISYIKSMMSYIIKF